MSTSAFTRRGRKVLSPRVKSSSRRSSILKKSEITPDKENTANMAAVAQRRKSSIGGGDKKRRVSFSQTIDVRTFNPSPSKQALRASDKKLVLQAKEPEPIPR